MKYGLSVDESVSKLHERLHLLSRHIDFVPASVPGFVGFLDKIVVEKSVLVVVEGLFADVGLVDDVGDCEWGASCGVEDGEDFDVGWVVEDLDDGFGEFGLCFCVWWHGLVLLGHHDKTFCWNWKSVCLDWMCG